MMINKDQSSAQSVSAKDFGLEKQFRSLSTGLDLTSKPLTSKALKDVSLSGNYYSNSIQMEDYSFNPAQIATHNFYVFPLHADFNELDDTFTTFKGLNTLFAKFSLTSLGSSAANLSPRSYISVFNHFRSDYEDFN